MDNITFTKPAGIDELNKMIKIRGSNTSKRFDYPVFKSIEDWLNTFNQWKDELSNIACQFLNDSNFNNYELAVTRNDHKMIHSMLNKAWLNAPDAIEIHSINGWNVLCHLCSEYDSWNLL